MAQQDTRPEGLKVVQNAFYLREEDNSLWIDRGVYGWKRVANHTDVAALNAKVDAIPPPGTPTLPFTLVTRQFSFDFASMNAGANRGNVFPFPEAIPGDFVAVTQFGASTIGVVFTANCANPGEVIVRGHNVNGSTAVDLPSVTFTVLLIKNTPNV